MQLNKKIIIIQKMLRAFALRQPAGATPEQASAV